MTVVRLVSEPDQVHSDLSDQADVYAVLSRSYAVAGDCRLAVLATWAADLRVLQSMLWESGLGSAPDPGDQLRAVAEAVMDSLSARAAADSPATPRSLVENARTALAAAFDTSVHALLAERFMSLNHLDALEDPQAEFREPGRAQRLGGRSVTDLVSELRVAATDCMAVARVMSAAGRARDAWHHVRMSDTAAFEAYLLDAAATTGDKTLATVDLRWDLAASVLADLPDDPADLTTAVSEFRQRLTGVVGPGEARLLLAAFEQFTPSPA